MASSVPPVKGSAYTTYISLVSQGDTDLFQTSVTLAAGDVTVYQDGVLDGNIDTLPVETGTSGILTVALSADEMNADTVQVRFRDAAGDEWQDALLVIHTVAQTLDTMDTNIDSILADTGTDGVALADDAITAAKIAADAIGASEIADGAIDAGAIASDAITAAKIAANAIGASEIADDAIDSGAIASGAIDADAIAANALGASELAADAATEIATAVWASTSRTLTQSAASVTAAVSGATISVMRGDSLSAAITGLGDISARSKLWFTVKSDEDDADTAAIIMIEVTAGLVYLNGADASGRAANGSITVDDESDGDITIALDEVETDDLTVQDGLLYDVQMLDTNGDVSTLTEGTLNVTADITRTVS